LKLKSTALIDLAAQASNLFHVGFNYITAANIPKPSWKTNRKYKQTRGEWVKLYTDELTLLGVGFGQTTKYCLLDIDRDSKYHPYNNLKAFKKVCQSLEKVGLVSYDIIRSSDSQGIHVYFHLPHAVNTFRLAALIHVTLINAGIDIRNGQIEQFPNPKDYGDKDHPTYYKPHRLPLQPNAGGMLLDENGEILTAVNLTHENMLAGFLRRAEFTAANQDIELLERKLNWAYDRYKSDIGKYQYHHKNQYSHIAQEWKENLELTLEIGWTGKHQTNTLLPSYIQYGIVFLGLTGEALAEWIYNRIIITRGYQEHCRHKHEIKKVIKGWVENTERKDYYIEYCGFPARSGQSPYKIIKHIKTQRNDHNQSLIERTKQRLAETLTALTALTKLPSKLTDRVKAIVAKSKELFGQAISRNTLYKPEYKSMWNRAEIAPDRTESTENSTPPSANTQTNTPRQKQPIDPKKTNQNSASKTLTQTKLSHTPPLYETLDDIQNLVEEESNLTTPTKHYNSRTKHDVTREPGKFELLANTLAKIIEIAALVVQVGLAAVDNQPADALEGETINSTPGATATEIGTELTVTEIEPLPIGPDPKISAVDICPESTSEISDRSLDRSSEQISQIVERADRQPDKPAAKPIMPRAYQPQTQPQHTSCPNCQLSTPAAELEQWEMCRFCAQKILWQPLI
jgi:hypothetical protein